MLRYVPGNPQNITVGYTPEYHTRVYTPRVSYSGMLPSTILGFAPGYPQSIILEYRYNGWISNDYLVIYNGQDPTVNPQREIFSTSHVTTVSTLGQKKSRQKHNGQIARTGTYDPKQAVKQTERLHKKRSDNQRTDHEQSNCSRQVEALVTQRSNTSVRDQSHVRVRPQTELSNTQNGQIKRAQRSKRQNFNRQIAAVKLKRL